MIIEELLNMTQLLILTADIPREGVVGDVLFSETVKLAVEQSN